MKCFSKVLLILILGLSIVSFAAAGGKKETTGAKAGTVPAKVVVKAMAYGNNSNQEGLSWARIVKAFEKENPNITIDYEMLYDEPYHQKVVARLAAGNVPDLAYMGADARWGTPWKEAGQQYNMKSLIDPAIYDLKLIPSMGPNGAIYEIPLGTSNITTVLYMNQTLVKSLGFTTPKTYADIVAMVPAAKKAGLDVVSIDGADGWAWGSCLMSVVIARLSGNPHWISEAVAGKHKFTDPAFINSLALIAKMVKDGVISEKSVLVDYGTNISNYNNKKALFMIQGQWASSGIEDKNVADNTLMLAWPKLPGEKASTAGSVAAAIQVGYGITKSGAAKPAVRDAAMKFINFYYSEPETIQRLKDGAIVAPILNNYTLPSDLPIISKRKVELAKKAMNTDVTDAYISGAANDALNAGMQKIASGQSSPAAIAAQVEKLIRKK